MGSAGAFAICAAINRNQQGSGMKCVDVTVSFLISYSRDSLNVNARNFYPTFEEIKFISGQNYESFNYHAGQESE